MQVLEQQRKELIRDIAATSDLLLNYKKSKMSDITRYNTLEEQLDRSEKLISTISEEIELLTENQNIETDPKPIPVNYDTLIIKMMKDGYRKKLLEPSSDIGHTLRQSYIHQLSQHNILDSKMTKLSSQDSIIIEKKEALIIENQRIVRIQSQLDSLSAELKTTLVNQEKTEAGLNQKVNEREDLNNKIKQLMLNSPLPSNTTYNENSGIESKKGFLSWPVIDGKILLRYGEQKHPDNEKLIYVNTGIDLNTSNRNVTSVYSGKIISVQNISSTNVTMIIQHDNDYFTVYSNLASSIRRKGDTVFQGENIGEINSTDGKYVIHFEIWKGRENLNPYHWLKNN